MNLHTRMGLAVVVFASTLYAAPPASASPLAEPSSSAEYEGLVGTWHSRSADDQRSITFRRDGTGSWSDGRRFVWIEAENGAWLEDGYGRAIGTISFDQNDPGLIVYRSTGTSRVRYERRN